MSAFNHFQQIHLTQLDALGIPQALQQQLQHKLENEIFDAPEYFSIEEDQDGDRQLVLNFEQGIKTMEDVFLIDHALSFPDQEVKRSLLVM